MRVRMIPLMLAAATLGLMTTPLSARPHDSTAPVPQAAAEELLRVDRSFSASSSRTNSVDGLSAMFDEDIIFPLPNGAFARGRAAAIEALRRDPFNASSSSEWNPIRVGLSADGQQGFTFGFMTSRGPDGAVRIGKYLAYWIRRPEGWRVAALRRARRPEGPVPTGMMPPSLPPRIVPITRDRIRLEADALSLRSAEQSFSDEAQRIGNGGAFQIFGSDDAMNMGRGPDFTYGARAIGAAIGPLPAGVRNPVNWHSDGVLVASSGDLGISWGVIRPNEAPAAGQPGAASFFTIWRRANRRAPWRYIAE